MGIAGKLKEMDCELPSVSPGKLAPAVRTGNLVYTSGAPSAITGKVGGDVTVEQGYEAAKQAILNLDVDIDGLGPIAPAELAAGLRTAGLAEQVLQAMIVGVLADGEPDPACFARVAAFAAALG